MPLLDQLTRDLQEALKSRDAARLSALRLLISAIRNKEIARKKPLEDSDVLELISTETKSRRESIDLYTKGGRPELAAKEEAELKALKAYLPEPLSEADLRGLIENALKTVGAKGPQDMGRVMSALMPQTKGRADGKQVQQLVQQLLSTVK